MSNDFPYLRKRHAPFHAGVKLAAKAAQIEFTGETHADKRFKKRHLVCEKPQSHFDGDHRGTNHRNEFHGERG